MLEPQYTFTIKKKHKMLFIKIHVVLKPSKLYNLQHITIVHLVFQFV